MTNSVTFPIALGCDGSTVDDSTSPTTGLDDGGHRERFIPALSQTLIACNTAVMAASVAAGAVLTTSSTSHTIGISPSSKTFTVTAGVANLIVSNNVRIHSLANPANLMYGKITSYVGTALTVTILNYEGSGTYTDWQIILAGVMGPSGVIDSTLITGMLKGDGSTVTAGVPNTDYLTPTAVNLLVEKNKVRAFSYISPELTLPAAWSDNKVQVIALDTDRELILIGGNNLVGIISNNVTGALGAITVIKNGAVLNRFHGIKSAANQVLISFSVGPTLEAITLTTSGVSIIANTTATLTSPTNIVDVQNMVQIGSSFVCLYQNTTGVSYYITAMSISGTTISIGTASAAISGALNSTYIHMYEVSTKLILCYSYTSGTSVLKIDLFSVSGTTLTPGTSSSTHTSYYTNSIQLSSTSAAVFSYDVGATITYGHIVTVSGTTANLSTVTLSADSSYIKCTPIIVNSTQMVVNMASGSSASSVNVLTNSSGTAVAGTRIVGTGLNIPVGLFGSEVICLNATIYNSIAVSITSNSPVVRYLPSLIGTSEINLLSVFPDIFNCNILPYMAKTTTLGVAFMDTTYFKYRCYNSTTDEIELITFDKNYKPLVQAWQSKYRAALNSSWAVFATSSTGTKIKLFSSWIA